MSTSRISAMRQIVYTKQHLCKTVPRRADKLASLLSELHTEENGNNKSVWG